MHSHKALRQLGRRHAAVYRAFGTDAVPGIQFGLTEEQRSLQELARRFAREDMMPKSAKYDMSGEYPREIFNKAWELGLVNMHIPTAYGGAGLHAMEGVIVG